MWISKTATRSKLQLTLVVVVMVVVGLFIKYLKDY